MSSIVARHDEQDIYLVEDDRGASGPVWCEARVLSNDFEAVVIDLLEGNHQCPRRVAVFNIAQGWVRDASAEVVHELRRRCDLQLRSIPLRAFTDRYEGRFADVQLPLPIPIGIQAFHTPMTQPVTPATFLGLPAGAPDMVSSADVVIFGAPDATPHVPSATNHAARAPAALRESTQQIARDPLRWDFDQDGPLIPEGLRAVDLGGLPTDPATPQENRSLIISTTASILKAGAVPLLLGGDDPVPIPFFAGFEPFGPVTILQIDAHLDWRDARDGLKHTFSSTMRRASEMPWVERIIQVGQRGIGGWRERDLADAQAWGVTLFSAATVRRHGVQPVIGHITPGSHCIVTLDCDGLDPAVIPAVPVPQPGGLGYLDIVELLHGVTQRARIVGFDLVELVLDADVRGLGVLAASRILCVALGCMARQRSAMRATDQ